MRPLAPVQLCRRRVLAPRTCLVFGIPSCCADAAHYGLSATPRFSAARRTDCETSSPPSTLLAAVHGSFRRARVLRGLSRPNMHQFYLSFHAPCQEMPTRQSGPLSQRIAEGCPRWATIASNTASLSGWQKLVSTSKAPAPGLRGDCGEKKANAWQVQDFWVRASSSGRWCARIRQSPACAVRHECEAHPRSGSQQPFGRSVRGSVWKPFSRRKLAFALCKAWPNRIGIQPGASGPPFPVRPQRVPLSIEPRIGARQPKTAYRMDRVAA